MWPVGQCSFIIHRSNMCSNIRFFIVIFLRFIWITLAQETCNTIDKQIGDCRPISTCEVMLDALNKVSQPVPLSLRTYLRSYNCGYENGSVKVCCPSKPIYFDEYTEDNYLNLLSEPPDVSSHKNVNLLPQECGFMQTKNRIFGGTQAELLEFPWMAVLLYKKDDALIARCAGTIINNKYVLTAAHCLLESLVVVRVGEYDTRTEIDCVKEAYKTSCTLPHRDLVIEEYIPHSKYNIKSRHHDIALLRVSSIDLSLENTKPICLPLGSYRNFDFTNKTVVVTGWGATAEDNPRSPVLKKVDLPVVALEKCSNYYSRKKHRQDLYERQLCAGGEKGKDSCVGDSGGPLQVIEELNGEKRYIQQGIVSYGPILCGSEFAPGVYVRVAYYMDWILDNIRPADPIPPPPDVSRHRNLNLLPKECGRIDSTLKSNEGRVAGLFEFPWMALLSFKTKKGPDFKCGATVINERYILTAAHCINSETYPVLRVRVGEHNISSTIDCEETDEGVRICAPPYQDLAIEEIIPHPKYSATSFINDIGLLRVAHPINLTLKNAKPICLPLDESSNYNFTNMNMMTTGWSVTESGGQSAVLLKGEGPVVSLEECQKKYRDRVNITHLQICAGGNSSSDLCAGSAGGPLQLPVQRNSDSDKRFVQQGVISFGPKHCWKQEGFPVVYTKVAYYMDWILDNMKP